MKLMTKQLMSVVLGLMIVFSSVQASMSMFDAPHRKFFYRVAAIPCGIYATSVVSKDIPFGERLLRQVILSLFLTGMTILVGEYLAYLLRQLEAEEKIAMEEQEAAQLLATSNS